MDRANDAYKQLRLLGFRREEARYVLPMALHTRYVVTMNVRSLINFYVSPNINVYPTKNISFSLIYLRLLKSL